MSEYKGWLPAYFAYHHGELWLEEVSLNAIAGQFGTPCYVYSANSIRNRYERYQQAFAKAGLNLSLLCYAVKANSNLSILRLLAEMGAGADVVSGGELFRALEAGIKSSKIVFAGVGKTIAEIDYALRHNICAFNVESAAELAVLERRAINQPELAKKVNVSIRCNPDVEVNTHPYITTGTYANKFGVDLDEALIMAQKVAASPVLKLSGLQMHVGSQLLSVKPVVQALGKLLDLAQAVEVQTQQKLEYLDIGGGLGVSYIGEQPEQPEVLAQTVANLMHARGVNYSLTVEPGRYIIAEAGTLLTEVLYLKDNGRLHFVVVDAAMNDLIRPALYQATHTIVPLTAPKADKTQIYEVVGPVCESGDWLGHGVELSGLEAGTRLAILSAGAYGFTMSSNYNSRLRAAEVLVDGKESQLIRRRETFEDLIAAEKDIHF